ncbi:MAG: transporter substrate-binding domain-containing protein [Chloroflexota bacterium]|nr:transporter substrate-binding domain-containing protein [Chloroflexota bacterium]
MSHPGRFAVLLSVLLVVGACAGPGATTGPTGAASVAPSGAASGAPSDGAPSPDDEGDDLLATIQEAGVIRVATDPAYPPQSELLPDGSFEGFDIAVATEIAERLDVEVQFETPDFSEVVAGGWNERFDISVGSVTVTEDRMEVLDFTEPYYYTPAQMTATAESGITTLDGLAGQVICVGETTTYQFWLEGSLVLAGGSPDPVPVPEGATVTTFSTDTECADAAASGRTEFQGWLSSSTTVATAIEAGDPFVAVGDPVFFEALAVATDGAGPAHAELQAELDRIVREMHEDGTLSALSEEWFDGLDLTVTE